MSLFTPKQVGSGTKPLNSKLGLWRRGVELGARAVYQKTQTDKKAAYALRKSSGVGKYGSQMTFRKLFGTARSEFSAYFKASPEYREWKQTYGGKGRSVVKNVTPDLARRRIRDLHTAMRPVKERFISKGGDPRKHYNSAKSIKILMKRNGITTVSKAAINMIKMLDGTSGAALISWHRQKYGGRPNLPESEVMAFLKDQVVPYVQVAVEREEALQKKVQMSGKTGSAGSLGTQPDIAHWDRRPRPPNFRPKLRSGLDAQPGYKPVPAPIFGNMIYQPGYDKYQRNKQGNYRGGKGKYEQQQEFESQRSSYNPPMSLYEDVRRDEELQMDEEFRQGGATKRSRASG